MVTCILIQMHLNMIICLWREYKLKCVLSVSCPWSSCLPRGKSVFWLQVSWSWITSWWCKLWNYMCKPGHELHLCPILTVHKWLRLCSRVSLFFLIIQNIQDLIENTALKNIIYRTFTGWHGSAYWALACEQKVSGLIPGQSTCLGCGPGSQLGACERQAIDVSLEHWCFISLSISLLSSLSINK